MPQPEPRPPGPLARRHLLTDAELFAPAATGDQLALAVLIERFNPLLLGYLRGKFARSGARGGGERFYTPADAAAETWAMLAGTIARYDPARSPFLVYLTRMNADFVLLRHFHSHKDAYRREVTYSHLVGRGVGPMPLAGEEAVEALLGLHDQWVAGEDIDLGEELEEARRRMSGGLASRNVKRRLESKRNRRAARQTVATRKQYIGEDFMRAATTTVRSRPWELIAWTSSTLFGMMPASFVASVNRDDRTLAELFADMQARIVASSDLPSSVVDSALDPHRKELERPVDEVVRHNTTRTRLHARLIESGIARTAADLSKLPVGRIPMRLFLVHPNPAAREVPHLRQSVDRRILASLPSYTTYVSI